jgi:hypothetical protein
MAVIGIAITSARSGSRQARCSIVSASTSSPSRNKITINATVAISELTNPERGSNRSTSNTAGPSTNPATTNTAVSDKKLRRATAARSAPTTSSAPSTSTVLC